MRRGSMNVEGFPHFGFFWSLCYPRGSATVPERKKAQGGEETCHGRNWPRILALHQPDADRVFGPGTGLHREMD